LKLGPERDVHERSPDCPAPGAARKFICPRTSAIFTVFCGPSERRRHVISTVVNQRILRRIPNQNAEFLISQLSTN
jgi:hypothetical protein